MNFPFPATVLMGFILVSSPASLTAGELPRPVAEYTWSRAQSPSGAKAPKLVPFHGGSALEFSSERKTVVDLSVEPQRDRLRLTGSLTLGMVVQLTAEPETKKPFVSKWHCIDGVRRACGHVGADRIEHHQRQQDAYLNKSLPEQSYGKPAEVEPPEIAAVMSDGGRLQLLDRRAGPSESNSARKGEHWKESRIGLLASMYGDRYQSDPQPMLPPELSYKAMAETLAEMGKTGVKLEFPDGNSESEPSSQAASDGLAGPTLQSRHVVASQQNWEAFGPLLASQAWYQGFAAASRKVFVSDGSPTIEKLQRTHFSHYTSVLDILHALSYSLAAARAVSDNEADARDKYDQWAARIWEGRVDDVID